MKKEFEDDEIEIFTLEEGDTFDDVLTKIFNYDLDKYYACCKEFESFVNKLHDLGMNQHQIIPASCILIDAICNSFDYPLEKLLEFYKDSCEAD